LRRKSAHFQAQLEQTIDTVLQDVYAATDEGHAAVAKEAATIMDNIKQSTTVINDFIPKISDLQQISDQLMEYKQSLQQNQHSQPVNDTKSVCSLPYVSPRWTNWEKGPSISNRWTSVCSENAATNKPTQTADPPVQGPPPIHPHAVDPPSSRQQQCSTNNNYCPPDTNTSTQHPIPHTVHLPVHTGDTKEPSRLDQLELPPVNHNAAIKHAKIQYTGLGDLFVFHTQLLNGMEQFGIYLSPLDTVKYQQSVCPAKYNHQPITPRRYRTMASTLYQKLQNPEVIPLEHTAIRNIINRYAEKNDGYKVLYAMLELVHPALHQDAVLLPPKSTECNEDVHFYAQKFDSWLKYEAYANRPYSARETVNLFLKELSPHFAPAISRIRWLMDT